MYYLCNESKDADQLGNYRAAELRIWFFAFAKSMSSHEAAHFAASVLLTSL